MPDLDEKVVDLVACSDALVKRAGAIVDADAASKAALAAVIPTVVKAALAHGRIRPDQQEKMAGMLTDPVHAVRLLEAFADPAMSEVRKPTGQVVKTARAVADRDAVRQSREEIDSNYFGRS